MVYTENKPEESYSESEELSSETSNSESESQTSAVNTSSGSGSTKGCKGVAGGMVGLPLLAVTFGVCFSIIYKKKK